MHDLSAAAESFHRLVKEFADHELCKTALLRLGEVEADRQRWANSERAFGEHRRRFPEDARWFEAQFGLAWAQEHLSRFESARASYQQIVDRHRGPTAARAQFQIGETLFAEERYEEAARALLKVDILFGYPEWSAAALYEAGRCFAAMGRRVEARQQFERVAEDFADTEWATLAQQQLSSRPRITIPGRAERDGNP